MYGKGGKGVRKHESERAEPKDKSKFAVCEWCVVRFVSHGLARLRISWSLPSFLLMLILVGPVGQLLLLYLCITINPLILPLTVLTVCIIFYDVQRKRAKNSSDMFKSHKKLDPDKALEDYVQLLKNH